MSRRTDGRRPEDPLLRDMSRPGSPWQTTATESAVLKAASLFEFCKEVVAEKRSALGELTEFIKNYTGFPKVRPQAAASVIGTMIELSLTWRIHTMFVVDVFADLDEDARPTIAIGPNVELHGWLLQAQLLQASGKLEDFFLSQLQALEGFRSSQADELLIAITQADSLIALPLVATESSPPDAMTYDQLPTFVPCVKGQEWVDAVNKQTEPYFRVEVNHHVRIDNATMQLVRPDPERLSEAAVSARVPRLDYAPPAGSASTPQGGHFSVQGQGVLRQPPASPESQKLCHWQPAIPISARCPPRAHGRPPRRLPTT
ncbi:hypothetical protein HPB48_008958 [Haemaphysalis longicornis]|uniref:Uncharacterized protein n=1 Tax=Haemaphysalis longicornis TaxID=44386 RepID=A0A9J6FSD5_HAELO|nr:hypothetical protein HPB48_008958 [Haemaphysalis longicornis]